MVGSLFGSSARRLRAYLPVAVLVATALGSPQAATAQDLPSCDPAVPPAVEPEEVPSQLAWGRGAIPDWDERFSSSLRRVGPVRISFTSADPADPISRPTAYDDQYPGQTLPLPPLPIVLEKGDGSGLITWQWAEGPGPVFNSATCQRSFTQTVTPIEGKAPRLTAATPARTAVFRMRSTCPSLFDPEVGNFGENFAAGEAKVTVSYQGNSVSIRRPDQCRYEMRPRVARGGKWGLKAQPGLQRVRFKARFHGGVHLFHYKLSFAGKVIKKGQFKVHVVKRSPCEVLGLC